MGIYCVPQPVNSQNEHAASPSEKACVSQCLTILGCSSSWWAGIHPNLPYYNACPPATSLGSNASGDRCNNALAFIEAQLFQLAYSQTANLSKVTDLTTASMGLHQQLDKWWDEFGEGRNLSHHPSDSEVEWLDAVSSAWIERAIRFHTLRILLIWSNSESVEDSDMALVDARCCLRLWVRALNSTQELASFAKFPRYVPSRLGVSKYLARS